MHKKPDRFTALLLALSLVLTLSSPAALAAELKPTPQEAITAGEAEEEAALSDSPASSEAQADAETTAEPDASSPDASSQEPEASDSAVQPEPENPTDSSSQQPETASSDSSEADPSSDEPEAAAYSAPAEWKKTSDPIQIARLIRKHWRSSYFQEAIVDPRRNRVTLDGDRTSFSDAFGTVEDEDAVLSSTETVEEYFEETPYEAVVQEDGTVSVTAPYQTCRIVVTAEDLQEDYGAEQILEYQSYDKYILQFPSEEATQAAYAQLVDRYGQRRCYVDQVITAEDTLLDDADAGDTYTASSWGCAYMGMDKLKAQASPDSAPLTVAIIDSGIDADHSFFQDRTICSDSYNFVEDNTDLADGTGHGTHVAGTIADCTPSNVELLILRVFDDKGSSSLLLLSSALDYALEHQANVVNMSLGTTSDNGSSYHYLDDAISSAYDTGVPICCAAGNSKEDMSETYPACNTQTLAISAIDDQGQFATSFPNSSQGSNYGDGVDFCAPGVKIVSADPGGGTRTRSGTSMSTPHVTAALTYLMTVYPDSSVSFLYDQLKEYATDLGDEGKDPYYGWGCVDLSGLAGRTCDHKWEKTKVVSPTCSEKGYTLYTCSLCSETYRDHYTDTIAHTWDEGTEQEDGSLLYTCTVCGGTALWASFDDGLRWNLDEHGNLVISGKGAVRTAPWSDSAQQIQSLTLEKGVTALGDSLFSGYSKLKTVDLGDSLTTIGSDTFYGCAIDDIYIPASVTKIGDGAFSNCTALETFSLSEDNTSFSVMDNAFLLNADCTQMIACAAGFNLNNNTYIFYLPSTVTHVRPRAFDNCTYLSTVVLPPATREIGDNAFRDCSHLGRIYFQCDYPAIASNAFDAVTATVSVTSDAEGWDASGAKSNYGGSLTWGTYLGNLADWDVTLNSYEWPYSGQGRRPVITVSHNGSTLTSQTHYNSSYSNNVQVGTNTAKATATGRGIYFGSKTVSFSIVPASLSGKTATLSYTKKAATGKALKPTVTIDGLTSGTDFTVAYRNNVNPGTATVTITGRGNYTGTIVKTFTIIPATPSLNTPANSSSGVTVKWNKAVGAKGYRIYRKVNGKGSWTKVKTISSSTATSWTDTSVSNGAKYVYTVRAYAKASGNTYWSGYSSSGKTTYRLSSSAISSVKNSSTRKMTLRWKQNTKASGYVIQYATNSSFQNAKSVTVSSGKTTSKTISNLTKGKKYYVRLRSFKTVSKTNYYSGWSGTKTIKISK